MFGACYKVYVFLELLLASLHIFGAFYQVDKFLEVTSK
jgi:hypothetical protein